MTLTFFRSAFTLLMLAIFIGICLWAYSRKQKNRFDEAANLPFADEDQHQLSQEDDSPC